MAPGTRKASKVPPIIASPQYSPLPSLRFRFAIATDLRACLRVVPLCCRRPAIGRPGWRTHYELQFISVSRAEQSRAPSFLAGSIQSMGSFRFVVCSTEPPFLLGV